MSDLDIDMEFLRQFEKGLDPRHPERSWIPARVLGYGEISTVLEISTGAENGLAYKRMPMFGTEQEAEQHEALHLDYVQVLEERIGLRVAHSDVARLADPESGRIIVYLVQERFPSEAIGHRAIHFLSRADIQRLVLAVLSELARVFGFSRQNKGQLEVGIDGQISNWAILGFDPRAGLGDQVELIYLDTSTPFLRKDGVEQLDAELFLRSAPSFLVWLLRLLFLEDVMTRYYDFRLVAIDLIANFYKEQRPELVPELVETANGFFSAEIQGGRFKALTVDEIHRYYRGDAWIWRLYLAFRKVDRWLHRLVGRPYPYILPDKIKR